MARTPITCAICLKEYKSQYDYSITQTVCNHFFCLKCLQKWLKNNTACPYCRYNLSKTYVIRHLYISKKGKNTLDNMKYLDKKHLTLFVRNKDKIHKVNAYVKCILKNNG